MKHKALVLNSDYTPINMLSCLRAFAIVVKGHADVIRNYPEEERVLHGATRTYPAPSVIRVNERAKVPYRRVPLTRTNILKRDGHACVYCGSTENLTLDHVTPKSKGGRDSWDNLVTACKPCNSKKGDSIIDLPEEIKVYKPHYLIMMSKLSGKVRDEWKPYLFLS